MNPDTAAKSFQAFVEVIRALRTPGTGCPWDLEQDHRSLRPFLIEEAYEVLEALDRGDDKAFCEELGDLLLQVVLHAQVAADRQAFGIDDVIQGIHDKMIRRHPHVFGSTQVEGSAEVLLKWDEIKAAEKGTDDSLAAKLERLPVDLPALQKAQRLGEKAAKAGIEEKSVQDELEAKIVAGAFELGDVLFSLCQLARRLGIQAEDALRESNRRFIDHIRQVEQSRS